MNKYIENGNLLLYLITREVDFNSLPNTGILQIKSISNRDSCYYNIFTRVTKDKLFCFAIIKKYTKHDISNI